MGRQFLWALDNDNAPIWLVLASASAPTLHPPSAATGICRSPARDTSCFSNGDSGISTAKLACKGTHCRAGAAVLYAMQLLFLASNTLSNRRATMTLTFLGESILVCSCLTCLLHLAPLGKSPLQRKGVSGKTPPTRRQPNSSRPIRASTSPRSRLIPKLESPGYNVATSYPSSICHRKSLPANLQTFSQSSTAFHMLGTRLHACGAGSLCYRKTLNPGRRRGRRRRRPRPPVCHISH